MLLMSAGSASSAMPSTSYIVAALSTRSRYSSRVIASSGNFTEALALQRKLCPFMDALFVEENPAPLRYALQLIGLETGLSAPPLRPMSDALKARLRAIVAALRAGGVSLPEAA